jgi:hypothetical protein
MRLAGAGIASLLVAAALPAAAFAEHKAPREQSARFSMLLRGSQATTWHSDKRTAAGSCQSEIVSDGDQMIRFHSQLPALLSVTRTGSAHAQFFPKNVDATAERGADFYEVIPIIAPDTRQCVGTRRMPASPMPGCGERSGTIHVLMGFTAASVNGVPPDEDLGSLVTDRPNQLRFRGVNPNFAGGRLGSSMLACPLVGPLDNPADDGQLFEAVGHLSEKQVFSHRRTLSTSASDVIPFNLPDGTYGRTIVTYNLELTRIR